MLSLITRLSVAVLFAYASYLNLNDPDPEIWVTLYALASLTVLFSAKISPRDNNKISLIWYQFWRFLSTILRLFCWGLLFWTAYTISQEQWMEIKTTFRVFDIEQMREIGGLVLVILTLRYLVPLLNSTQKQQSTISNPKTEIIFFSAIFFCLSVVVYVLFLKPDGPPCGPPVHE